MRFFSLFAGLLTLALTSGASAQAHYPLVEAAGRTTTLPAGSGLQLNASTTANPALNIPCSAGIAPASPQDGDEWCTPAGLFLRVGGLTIGPMSGAGVTSFDGRTGAVTFTGADVSGAGGLLASNNLADLSNASAGRSNLGVAIGSNVEAWSANLDALAALNTTGDFYYLSAANTWSPVAVGTGLTFTGGTLAVSGGGGGGGTVTTTGSPTSGALTRFSGATSITNGDLSGDCTTSGALATTCTTTGGVAFGPFATGTSAADLTGTVPNAAMPDPGGSALGGVESKSCPTSSWLSAISTSGVPACTQPAFSDVSGSASAAQISPNLSAAIDAAFGSTQGQLLERGSSAWHAIAPGAAGLALVSNGAGADPSYQSVSSGGGGVTAALPPVMWNDMSGLSTTSSGNATVGQVVYPLASFAITGVLALVDASSANTYTASVWVVNSSFVIQSNVATSTTISATGASANWQTLTLPLNATMSFGTIYVVAISRTDGTTTSDTNTCCNTVSGGQFEFRGAPIIYGQGGSQFSTGVVLASKAPTTGNTFITFAGTLGIGLKANAWKGHVNDSFFRPGLELLKAR